MTFSELSDGAYLGLKKDHPITVYLVEDGLFYGEHDYYAVDDPRDSGYLLVPEALVSDMLAKIKARGA